MGGRYVPSLLAAIGEVIERHMIEIGFMGQRLTSLSGLPDAHAIPLEGARARFCPRCGDASFVKLEGCDSCLSCGYSKCS
jgi:ribonucleoside-diphosphate reductase alpha chain